MSVSRYVSLPFVFMLVAALLVVAVLVFAIIAGTGRITTTGRNVCKEHGMRLVEPRVTNLLCADDQGRVWWFDD